MRQRIGNLVALMRKDDLGSTLLNRLGLHMSMQASLYEVLYLCALFAWVFISVLGESLLKSAIPHHGMRMVITLLVGMGYVVFCWRPNLRQNIAEACVLLVALCAFRADSDTVGMSVVLAWCARSANTRRSLLASFAALVLSLSLVLALAALGLIPDISFLRDYTSGEVSLRHCLGFDYTTFMSHYWLGITMLVLYLQEWRPSIVSLGAIVAGNVTIYLLTDSRNSFLLVFAVLICLVTYRPVRDHTPRVIHRAVKFLFAHPFIICFVVSAVVLLLIPADSGLGKLVDKVFTSRIKYTQSTFSHYPITILGQKIQWSTRIWVEGRGILSGYRANGSFVESPYMFVDNSYLNLLISTGIIPTALVLLGLELTTTRLVRSRRYGLAATMVLFAVHSVLDPQLLYLHYTPFLVVVGTCLATSNKNGDAAESHVIQRGCDGSQDKASGLKPRANIGAAVCGGLFLVVLMTVPFLLRDRPMSGMKNGVVASYYTLVAHEDGTIEERYDGSVEEKSVGNKNMRKNLLAVGNTYALRKVVWHTCVSPTVTDRYRFSMSGYNDATVWLGGKKLLSTKDAPPRSANSPVEDIESEEFVSLSQGECVDLVVEWSIDNNPTRDEFDGTLYWQAAGNAEPVPVPAECLYIPRDVRPPKVSSQNKVPNVDTGQAQLQIGDEPLGGTIRVLGRNLDTVSAVVLCAANKNASIESVPTRITAQDDASLSFEVPQELSAGSWRVFLRDKDDVLWLTDATFVVVDAVRDSRRAEQPRPDLARSDWQTLNGTWEFGFDRENLGMKERWYAEGAKTARPGGTQDPFNLHIQVPYSWTSTLSGIGDASDEYVEWLADYAIGWYRTSFNVPDGWDGSRVFLRFGAVDADATVWVNEQKVCAHRGGYTSFEVDVTDVLVPGDNTVVVRAYDAGRYGSPWIAAMVGSQGSEPPFGHTYTGGIWQSVWLERRDDAWLSAYATDLDLAAKTASMTFDVVGQTGMATVEWDLSPKRHDAQAGEDVALDGEPITGSTTTLVMPVGLATKVNVPVDVDKLKLWSAEDPVLYEGTVAIRRDGSVVDQVQVSLGFRQVATMQEDELGGTVLTVNGDPTYLEGAIVQGFWEDGVYTAPTADDLRRDVLLAKELGFNAVRVFEKIEDPQFYLWCDKVGVYVFQDVPDITVPDVGKRGEPALGRVLALDAVRDTARRDGGHPSVVALATPGADTSDGRVLRVAADGMSRMQWHDALYEDAHAAWSNVLVTDSHTMDAGHAKLNDLDLVEADASDWAHLRDGMVQWAAASKEGAVWNYEEGSALRDMPLVLGGHDTLAGGMDGAGALDSFLWQVDLAGATPGVAASFRANLYDVEYDRSGLLSYDRASKVLRGVDANSLRRHGPVSVSLPEESPVVVLPGKAVSLDACVSNWQDKEVAGTLKWRLQAVDDKGTVGQTLAQGEQDLTVGAYARQSAALDVSLPGYPCEAMLTVELVDGDGATLATDCRSVDVALPGGVGQVIATALEVAQGR